MQEPASVGFSVLNLLVHFQGFSSFLVLIFYKLPLQPKGPYYEYVGLWTSLNEQLDLEHSLSLKVSCLVLFWTPVLIMKINP